MPPFEYNNNCSCARCRIHGLMGPALIVTVGVLMLLRSFGRIYMHEIWPGAFMLVIGLILLGARTASAEGHVQPGRPAMMPPPPQYQYPYPPQAMPGVTVPPPSAGPTTPPQPPPQPYDQQVKP